MPGKYVAYVGTYTHGRSNGIYIYDIDEEGSFSERCVVPVNNPSNICISRSGDFLYSIADEGLVSFKIEPDGGLSRMNTVWTNGMRGCYVTIDSKDRYLFMGGYHDGKVTVMSLNKDGSIGGIADEIYHQGLGNSFSEKSSGPHVACVKLTSDDKYLCAVDSGLSQVRIYTVDYGTGKLKLYDIFRCKLESEPRRIRFTRDGKFGYILQQDTNVVEVVKYSADARDPLTSVAKYTVVEKEHLPCDSVELMLDDSEKYLYVSIDIFNAVSIYERDENTGLLELVCCNNISGNFPKVVAPLPSGKRFVSLNHESNEIQTFAINFEKKYFLMCQPPIRIDQPNCIRIYDIERRQ